VAKGSFVGELIHFNAVRLRVTGSGNLRLSLRSLDNINVSTLAVLPMLNVTNRELVTLSNYIDQLGQLELKTTAINETFSLSRIVIFVKPIATSHPQ